MSQTTNPTITITITGKLASRVEVAAQLEEMPVAAYVEKCLNCDIASVIDDAGDFLHRAENWTQGDVAAA